MCGIAAARVEDGSSERAYRGLEKLEYRGYDSAGIAHNTGEGLAVEKKVGEVSNLEVFEGSDVAVGHTRWATHGGVTEENAHPHTGCTSDVAVVHNGIIENFAQLKHELESRGHDFSSSTDSEVVPHLVEEYISEGDDLREALERADDDMEGSYAVVAITSDGEMAALRRDSPLVIGVADDGYYAASDVNAFLEFTDTAVYLEEEDTVKIGEELEIFNGGERVERGRKTIDWNAEEASKKGYDHFMEKEIHEQSSTIKRAAFQNETDLEEAAEMLREAETVYVTGCGTASYAGVMGCEYLREAGFEPVFEQSHELEYRADEIGEDDVVVAVSQSGETADLLSALRAGDGSTLAVVNVVGSTLARESEKALFVNAGPEIGVASTKAFTAQLTVLKLLAAYCKGEHDETRQQLVDTAAKVEDVIDQNKKAVERLSKNFSQKEDVYFIGRGKGRILSYESALKLKELSYIHAEGFAGGEFKHGTLALVEEGVPVVAFTGHHSSEIESNAIEARSRGAEIVACGPERPESADFFVEVPEDPNRELLEIVPFQMLAYRTSALKDHDPDKPRNLAKSVTVK